MIIPARFLPVVLLLFGPQALARTTPSVVDVSMINGILQGEGCTNPNACNYDASATIDDGSCVYPGFGFDCDGNCLADADGDGVCDGDEIAGCLDMWACNFDPAATDGDGSCIYADTECEVCNDNGGVDPIDSDGDSVLDCVEVVGCQNQEACNYSPEATDPGECHYLSYVESGCGGGCLFCGDELVLDTDGDGVCNPDEICGCTDENACNFSPDATFNDGSCDYPMASCVDCDGELILDSLFYNPNNVGDGSGDFYGWTCIPELCGSMGIEYCSDPAACNFTPCELIPIWAPWGSEQNCVYPPPGINCEQYYQLDYDADGVLDVDEVEGCTSPEACNYDPNATNDSGDCLFIDEWCEYCQPISSPIQNLFEEPEILGWEIHCVLDVDNDGICDCNESPGCTDDWACNYDPGAWFFPSQDCVYPADFLDCAGECISDSDGDGVCDEFEIPGCLDVLAVNYLEVATDSSVCFYPEDFVDEECLLQLSQVQEDLIAGNYCGEGTLWSPTYQTCLPDPSCVGDLNGDDVVGTGDLLVLLGVYGEYCPSTGCTLPYASNYNPEAQADDATCLLTGCSDPSASNFYPGINSADDSQCIYTSIDSTGSCLGLQEITYHDYSYSLVEIGNHCWFKENLRTTKFKDGSDINFSDGGSNWENQTSGAYTLPGGSFVISNTFGYLYNWPVVEDERGICPEGWYPADSSAWNEVISIAGGAAFGAPAMRVPGSQEAGNGLWEMNNGDATNSTGFSGIPSGYRLPNGNYGGLYSTGQFWGGESLSSTNARSYYLNQTLTNVGITQNSKSIGLAVRCAREASQGCTEPWACNFDPDAEIDDGTCLEIEVITDECGQCEFCGDTILNDLDGDGFCDYESTPICSDPIACNYQEDECGSADNSVCLYPAECEICTEEGGVYDLGVNEDGTCNVILGCTDPSAVNWHWSITTDDGSCVFLPDTIDLCESNAPVNLNDFLEWEPRGFWTKRLTSEEVQAATGYSWFNSNTYAFNRENREIYSLSSDAQTIYVLSLESWTISERDASGWGGNLPYASDLVYNPQDQMLYVSRTGLDRVNRVSITGGQWEQFAPGGYDSYRYGAQRFYNGFDNVMGTHGGYGWFQSRRDMHFATEGEWQLIEPNTSGVEPFKRHNHGFFPDSTYQSAFIIDGKGSSSGDQWQQSCDIPGGYDYATDIGAFCWLRDVWRYDFADNSFHEILPVNSDFPVKGLYGFDYSESKIWAFGGYIPSQVYGGDEDETDSVFVLDVDESPYSWQEVPSFGDYDYARSSISIYDESIQGFVVLSTSGIYQFEFLNNSPQVIWEGASPELTWDFDSPSGYYSYELSIEGQTYLDSVFLEMPIVGCMEECAWNYDPSACVDFGLCFFPAIYCESMNDPNLTICEALEACEQELYGCMNPDADNFNPDATMDPLDECLFTGCFDPNADNFWILANTGDQEELCNY